MSDDVTQPAAVSLSRETGLYETVDGKEYHVFHLLQCKHGLRLEIRTGMKLSNRGSVLKAAQNAGYTTKKTKAGALADIEAILAKIDAQREGK